MDVVMQDLTANGLTIEDAIDRAKWSRLNNEADPGESRDYCQKEDVCVICLTLFKISTNFLD